MQAKCQNFVLFLDEIDKVSLTEKGVEINGVLTHFIDPQGDVEDKYLETKMHGKNLFVVFAFNDPSRVDSILRDRMDIVETHSLTKADKLIISRSHLIKSALEEVGYGVPERREAYAVDFADEALVEIIDNYTLESGARELGRVILNLTREVCLQQLDGRIPDGVPYHVGVDFVRDILGDAKVKFTKVHSEPDVGIFNGLWASNVGVGGILAFQISPLSEKTKDLHDILVTGNVEKVMKESVNTAATSAWSLLTDEKRAMFIKDGFPKCHFHAPSGGTVKDGCSGGGAICLTLLSVLLNKRLRNDVAMTGEIDNRGRISEIGGVSDKLIGAHRAGIKLVLLPEENRSDLDKLRERAPYLFKGPNKIKVELISNVREAVPLAFKDRVTLRK